MVREVTADRAVPGGAGGLARIDAQSEYFKPVPEVTGGSGGDGGKSTGTYKAGGAGGPVGRPRPGRR